ncbi:MAG: M23 family metallopeptidase, partial [bacterium]|nr:M23 family metallopeptidase [bacterium]
MVKGKKRKQYLSILLIPDDYSDPFSFKVKIRTVKILAGVALILLVHIFAGSVYYIKYSVANRQRHQLERDNINLREDNRRVTELYDQVEEMLQYYSQFREALGLDKGFKVSERKKANYYDELRRNVNMVSYPAGEGSYRQHSGTFQESRLDFFLTREESNYHNFAKNIPTYLPVEGFLTTDFRNDDWFLPDHYGIDIATSRGTNVHAAAEGVVIFSTWTEDLGNLIIIYHFNGFFTVYGHNQVLLKKENSFVRKGETIALLGSSG